MFDAIEKSSIPKQIVDYFLDSISKGNLKQEERLPSERDLGEILGVSRSTLREGLRILEVMGVIEKRSDGTFIKLQDDNILREAIDIDFAVEPLNYFELIEVRNLLEAQSAVLASKNATPDDIGWLESLREKMEKSLGDVEKYASYGTEFHIAIAKVSKNDILYQIFESIRHVMFDYQKNNMRTKEDLLHSYTEHLGILEAIRAGDSVLSGERMRSHLQYSQDLYEVKSERD